MKSKIDFQPQQKILEGVNKLADVVGSTLGPRGNNVAYSKYDGQGNWYADEVQHDGVSIANAVELEDESEAKAARILREAARKTVDTAGDGTTVTLVLAQAIIQECFKAIGTGTTPQSLRKGLEEGRDKLLVELEKYATPINTLKDEERIATISAENPELGKLVAEVLHKLGPDGVITVEESKSNHTDYEIQQGLQFEPGYAEQIFITDPRTMTAVFENTYLLLTDKSLGDLTELKALLEAVINQHAHLVIIAGGFEGLALPLLARNKFEAGLQVLPIRAPSFGSNQKNILQDIATITGGKFFNSSTNFKLSDIKMSDLGYAKAVVCTKSSTIISGGRGLKKDVDIRIEGIKKQIEEETEDFEENKLRERLGKLTNGVASIKVGGYTEIEMKERKERVIDAVHATKAAMKEGIVPGGETIYLQIRDVLSQDAGGEILWKALEAPFRKLLTNAGIDAGRVVDKLDKGQGIDVIRTDIKTLSIVDMVMEGIIDPLLVPKQAIQNAVSVAIQLMTTGTIVNKVGDRDGKM